MLVSVKLGADSSRGVQAGERQLTFRDPPHPAVRESHHASIASWDARHSKSSFTFQRHAFGDKPQARR
jgi:hypothetical protein